LHSPIEITADERRQFKNPKTTLGCAFIGVYLRSSAVEND
jgi:hypothetical protein